MVNKEFFQVLDALEKESRIPKEQIIEAVEAGLASAFKKEEGFPAQIKVRLNEEKNTIRESFRTGSSWKKLRTRRRRSRLRTRRISIRQSNLVT